MSGKEKSKTMGNGVWMCVLQRLVKSHATGATDGEGKVVEPILGWLENIYIRMYLCTYCSSI